VATGRDLRARLVLSLNDRASPGLDRIPGRLDRIRGALRRISVAAAVVGGLSLLGPMQQAAAFEDVLRQNAITAGQTGAALEAMIQRTRGAYERLARETGQRSRDIAQAASSLIAAGLDSQAVDALLPTIARVATATGSSMEDLSQTAFQLQQQMGLTAAQMPQAFAALVQAGRDGNFELRDMAREFPNILTMARALGMQGPGAVASLGAALQVARTAAGTSGEAATNIVNALQKLASPDTRRNFAEIGVDLERVLADASRRGINPFEAVVQKLRERTGGNLSRLSDLFGDRQALMGLLPMIQQTARYLEIRDRAAQAQPDIVDRAFLDRMHGAEMALKGFGERLEQLYRRLLLVAGTGLAPVNDALDQLFGWIAQIDAAYPGLIDQVAAWAAGLVVAAAGVGLLGQAVSFLGAGLTIILAPLRLAFLGLAAIVGIKVAIFAAAIALVAGAAYVIWRYWDRIGPWFRQLWATIVGWFRGFVDWVSGWAGAAYAGAVRIIEGAWVVLRTWFNTLWNTWVREPFIAFVAWLEEWTNGGVTRAVERFQRAWEGVKDWFRGLWEGLKTIFEGVWGPIERAMERAEAFFQRHNAGAARYQPDAQAELGARMGAAGAQRIPDSEWNAADDVPPARTTRVVGEIVVRPAPGAEVTEARTTSGPVTIAPDRGATRSRP
jgi:TP901 family phage tail tape measure protein